MKKFHTYTHIYLVLISFVFITSCSGQEKSTATNSNESINQNNSRKSINQSTPPRFDSVLQFGSMVTVIFEDSKGNIWFGSHCDGVCRYDGKQFSYFTVEQGLPNARVTELYNRKVPLGNSIRYIQEDKSGNIWFGTGDGVSRFDGQSFTTIYPEKESLLITDSFRHQGNDSDKVWDKELNHLWFGDAEKNGVYRYDGHQLTHLTFPAPSAYDNGSPWQYATYSLFKDKDGNIWFGTEGGGIMRYNGGSFTCINEKEEKGVVRSFFQDDAGKVWISNVLMGLYYYDHSAHQAGRASLTNFTKEKGYYSLNDVRSNGTLDKSKMLDGIQTIAQDDEGNLWFGTYSDGLWRYDGEELTHFTKQNGLPSNTVKTIYKDKKGNLWFGMGETQAFLYHFNGSTFDKFKGDRKH